MPAPLSDRELLARLVAFETTSDRTNLPLVDFLAAYLDEPGVTVRRLFSPDRAKAALVVQAGPPADAYDRSGIVLCGHTDVVGAQASAWHSHPFELTEIDGRYVGRGACDMKGFLAVAANAMKRLDHAGLKRQAALLFTYDEELNTRGARETLATWPDDCVLPRDVLVGEPTALEVVHMHKGMLELSITIEGIAAHSGYPHLGQSAIEPAARVVNALAELRRTLETEPSDGGGQFPEVPFAALNTGTIEGGTAVNVVPDRCRIGVSVRMLPGMEPATMVERVTAAAGSALRGETYSIGVVSESPPMHAEPGDPLIKDLLQLAARDRPQTVSYATDAGWLQTAGYRCAIFGPGSIAVAHKPNEYVTARDLEAAADVVRRLISRRCGG